MRMTISNDEATGTSRQQNELPTVSYFDVLAVANDVDWDADRVRSRTSVILCSAYPDSWRQVLNRARKRIARQADDDLRQDIEATIAATRLMQAELDKRTYEAKLKRVNDAAKSIERDAIRLERKELMRRGVVRGLRNKP